MDVFGIADSGKIRQAYQFFNGFFAEGPYFSSPCDDGVPNAYLNYLLFDKDYNLMDAGFQPLTEAGEQLLNGSPTPHELLQMEANVTKEGYIYIYLSNENDMVNEVFFDDLKIEHFESPVIQSDDYYPFGLTFNSYKRENSVANKYLFNKGSELQSDLDLGVYHTKFRVLDPVLGRWWQIDPLADKSNNYTPYAFVMNNPLRYSDRVGLDTLDEVVVKAKRLANTAINWFTGSNVGYKGSGWGHGPRRYIADKIGLGNTANNIVELGLHSQLQSSNVSLEGDILDKIKDDPDLIRFQNQIIKILKADPRFKNVAFVRKERGNVGFGGYRGEGNWDEFNSDNPILKSATWEVAGSELTWAVRNVGVTADATVKSDGTIVINFSFTDTLDLSPQQGRPGLYNTISSGTGFLYHDVLGGNSEINVNANWQTIIK